MALPFDIGPHRPAPEVRQQADATAVRPSGRAVQLMQLFRELRKTKVQPDVEKAAGRGFADTLAVLTGAAPGSINDSTAFGDVGDFWPLSNKMSISPKTYYGDSRDKAAVRATMAHEFGHLLDKMTSDLPVPGFEGLRQKPLSDRFAEMNPRAPLDLDETKETFADTYAQALSKVLPEVGQQWSGAYQYRASPYWINARQQALLDSLVRARLGRLKQAPVGR